MSDTSNNAIIVLVMETFTSGARKHALIKIQNC